MERPAAGEISERGPGGGTKGIEGGKRGTCSAAAPPPAGVGLGRAGELGRRVGDGEPERRETAAQLASMVLLQT